VKLKFEFFSCLFEFGVCGYDHIDLGCFWFSMYGETGVYVSQHDIIRFLFLRLTWTIWYKCRRPCSADHVLIF